MMKIEIVCQQCGATMELCQKTPEEVYYDNFGYAEENNPQAIELAIKKILNDFENKSLDCFKYNL